MSRNKYMRKKCPDMVVTSREGRVSRNFTHVFKPIGHLVTSREGRVSRNQEARRMERLHCVTSREGRVSRNSAG